MVWILIILTTFLWGNVANAHDVTLDYDFITKEIVLSWPRDDVEYIIDVFDRTNDDCVIDEEAAYTMYVTHTEDDVRFELVEAGSYRVKLFYSEDGEAKTELYLDKKINFGVGKKTSKYSWCSTEDAEYYRVYYKESATDEFLDYFEVKEVTDIEIESDYFTETYLVVRAVATIDEEELESGDSPEVIVFTGIPPELKELRLSYE